MDTVPKIIGLYGLPASGKTTLLKEWMQELGEVEFAFYEGSEVLDSICPGGLVRFKTLPEYDKSACREVAIKMIHDDCKASGRTGVVVGHYSFWTAEDKSPTVLTASDWKYYTHILYLDTDPEEIASRLAGDLTRDREQMSIDRRTSWQDYEKEWLQRQCRAHDVLFMRFNHSDPHFAKVASIIRNFRFDTELNNHQRAMTSVDRFLSQWISQPPATVLVLDGDKTLAADDTGDLFWQTLEKDVPSTGSGHPLSALFGSELGYSYTAFRQAALLYEQSTDDSLFDDICEQVAAKIKLYPEIKALLREVAQHAHVGVLVVTCGLRRMWEKILLRAGLTGRVRVIGGGRIGDGLVVTSRVKGCIVRHLQRAFGCQVWAFGDGPLDVEMLNEAAHAIIVVGDEKTRSKSMDQVLLKDFDHHHPWARQVLLPPSVQPRIGTNHLPLVDITSPKFLSHIIRHRDASTVNHATNHAAAKLLQTPMRDASLSGPALRDAHYQAGRYLAIHFLSSIIGLEEHEVQHVQGYKVTGHRLSEEPGTLVVALMRGGEPMALGVNAAFPLAQLLHARKPTDITPEHLDNCTRVILVDSVINNGTTMVDFVKHIRSLVPMDFPIVLVAGVVQDGFIDGAEGMVMPMMEGYGDVRLVALRISKVKYTGSKSTDSGNRLFNTLWKE